MKPPQFRTEDIPSQASILKPGMYFKIRTRYDDYNYKIRLVQNVLEIRSPLFREAIKKKRLTRGNLLVVCQKNEIIELHPTSRVYLCHKV